MAKEGYGQHLAQCYDMLNDEIDSAEWADFYEKCFEKYTDLKVKHICEMACGTGSLALELGDRGYGVTAFDLSCEMLTEADAKMMRCNVKNVLFTQQDMRNFKVYTKVEAVVCMLDSLNCLPDNTAMTEALSSAFDALAPGGLFVFDVNSKYKFENVYANNAYILEGHGVFLGWQNFYNKKTRVCDMELNFFIEDLHGKYDCRFETVREKMYTRRTLDKLVRSVGFEVCDCVSDFDFSPADENADERLFYICKKPEI